MQLVLYLIGFSQLGKLLFGLWVIWVGVWVVLLCQLKRDKEAGRKIRTNDEKAQSLSKDVAK